MILILHYCILSEIRLLVRNIFNSGQIFLNFPHFGWIFRVSPTEIISLSEMIWASTGPDHLTLSQGLDHGSPSFGEVAPNVILEAKSSIREMFYGR